MNGGRLTTWLEGREALPVRAIPYVTGWQYSPDVVAESLARATAAPFEKLRSLVAYHRPTGKPQPVMSCEWSAPLAEVKGFEAELREQRPDVDVMDDHAGYAAWRTGAALKLPAGVWVWLDEFLREREADRKRTPDDRPVTLAPMLDADTRAAVLEGFEDCPRRGPDTDTAVCIDEEAVAAMFGERENETEVDAQKRGAGVPAKPEWVRQAWEIGTEWMLAEEKRTGERPIVVAIAKHVEGELSTRSITGARGKYLDWESIKREALTGITGRGKGDNFRNRKGNPHRKKKSPIVKA